MQCIGEQAADSVQRQANIASFGRRVVAAPSHAKIPAIEAYFLDETDDKTNPLKIKGVGELGICGAGAALANAVYNTCSVRVHDYPVTVDKVPAGLMR